MRELKVAITVRPGVDDDAVVEELERVIEARVAEWYESRGKSMLACEPS